MVVSVRLFAGLRERAGSSHVDVELPEGATVADLLAVLELAPRSCVAAINREYADAAARIAPGDEVALVPPVSGGDGTVRRVRVTAEPLDVAALSAVVRDPRAGAVVLFEGVTREPKLGAIAEEEAERHGLCGVAVEHRTGTVPRGEPSVIVATSAPHRGEAFAAARAVIDRVKAEAPIWKVEVDGADRRRVEGTLPPVS
jgi:MoaE-MoaD fusion protein